MNFTVKLLHMKMHTSYYYQTANLRIYPSTGQVQRQLEEIRLGPINMQVLITLLDRHGQVVSRNELFELVWKNQIVSDDTLTRCISDLRSLLGHHQSYAPLIQTLPKRGYRWLPEVQVMQEAQEDNDNNTAIVDTPVEQPLSEVASESNIAMPFTRSESRPTASGKRFSWRSAMRWGGLSLLLLLAMTYTAIWMARTTTQTHYVSIALLPSQVSSANFESIGSELDHHLKQQILASKHLRYLSQRAINKQSLADIAVISHHFGAKWIIESQITQQNQFFRVSLSLVDSRSSLVLYEKARNFRNTQNQTIDVEQREEIEAFSKEFVLQAEEMLKDN
jgi:DNA-binding winged helix-turn-helix (wHTH) protein/TolB-like protein